MNTYKRDCRENILNFIAGEYVKMENDIIITQGCIDNHTLEQKWGTCNYLMRLIKNIGTESPKEIAHRLNTTRDKYFKEVMK